MSLGPDRRLPVVQMPGGCGRCVLFERGACYGLTGFEAALGCGAHCGPDCAEKADWTCIHRRDLFDRLRDVGFPLTLSIPLRMPEARPLCRYVPGIHHGKRRARALERPWVMVPLHKLVPMRGGPPRPVASDRAELEREFMIGPTTEVIVTGVAQDDYLEWLASFGGRGVGRMLAALNVRAVTGPNHSLFPEAPQMHTVWNRLRSLRMCERWSEEGVAVIPHVNARDENDWRWWRDYFRRHPEIDCVAKEFQTGNAARKPARTAIDDLAWLQEELGRSLHLFAIGAKRRMGEIKARFDAWTLMDSKPFMATMHRELRVEEGGERRWVSRHTAPGEPLDDRFEVNITHYDEEIAAVPRRTFRAPRQYLLRLRLK